MFPSHQSLPSSHPLPFDILNQPLKPIRELNQKHSNPGSSFSSPGRKTRIPEKTPPPKPNVFSTPCPIQVDDCQAAFFSCSETGFPAARTNKLLRVPTSWALQWGGSKVPQEAKAQKAPWSKAGRSKGSQLLCHELLATQGVHLIDPRPQHSDSRDRRKADHPAAWQMILVSFGPWSGEPPMNTGIVAGIQKSAKAP